MTASDDKTARVWDLEEQDVVSIFRHRERVYSASFSPDNESVVTASEDNLGYVWDISTSDLRRKLVGHQHWVNSAAFNTDGTRIVTGSKDGTARVWDAQTGRTIAILSGHSGGVESVAFSSDGKTVVTASDDKTARLWDVSAIPAGDIARIACILLNGNTGLSNLAGSRTLDRPICEANLPAVVPSKPKETAAAR